MGSLTSLPTSWVVHQFGKNVQPSNPLPKLWIELVSWTPSKWCQQISRHPTNTAQGGRFLSCTSPPQICTFDGQPARMWQNKSAGGIANTWCLATMRVAYWERPQGWYSNISCHEHEVQNILAPSTPSTQATVFAWLVRVMPSGFRNCTIYQTFGTTQIRLFICNLPSTKCMIWSPFAFTKDWGTAVTAAGIYAWICRGCSPSGCWKMRTSSPTDTFPGTRTLARILAESGNFLGSILTLSAGHEK